MLSLLLILQMFSCDCQPNCNCLIACECDANLLLTCSHNDRKDEYNLISTSAPTLVKQETPSVESDAKPAAKPVYNTNRQPTYYPTKPSNTKRYIRPTTKRTAKSTYTPSCNT